MAAGLVVPVSGPYTATFDGYPLGTMNDDGYELACTLQGQEVNESDAYGMTLVEAIYRGMNWRCRFRGLEFNKTGLLAILQMFGQTGANTTLTPLLTAIGDRWTKFCKSLILTSILTPYPPTMPLTLTALSAGFSPNTTSQFLLTSKVREMPLELVFLPYASGSPAVNIPFSTT
jgi:hypothetical protein